jgi:hypothetical protein
MLSTLPDGNKIDLSRYIRFIESRPKNRKKGEGIYYERHHKVPKFISNNGSWNKDEVILLTAREHFIAHLILWKAYRNTRWSQGAALAFHMMKIAKTSLQKDRYVKLTARQFESLRIDFIKVNKSENIRQKKRHFHKGDSGGRGKPKSEKHKQHMRKPKSKEHIQHMIDFHKNEPLYICSICNRSVKTVGGFANHYESCKKKYLKANKGGSREE